MLVKPQFFELLYACDYRGSYQLLTMKLNKLVKNIKKSWERKFTNNNTIGSKIIFTIRALPCSWTMKKRKRKERKKPRAVLILLKFYNHLCAVKLQPKFLGHFPDSFPR